MRRGSVFLVCAALVAGVFGLRAGVAASAQDRATQIDGQPASFYWAVLVGISDYSGKTEDLAGAAPDARTMRDYLVSIGWRSDHIYLLTDSAATRANIVAAVRWLAAKTNNRSAAVFHFSGHEMPFTSRGARHVTMRTYENKYLWDTDFGSEMSKVHAARVWIDLSLCRAGGFDDAGTVSGGRVVTYSSPESELSYDDPNVGHSVFADFEIVQAMQSGKADRNGDGQVTVEEAFWWARQPVTNRTSGRQHPAIVDKLSGDFILRPPAPAPAPPPAPTPHPTPSPAPTCVPGTDVCLP